MINEAVASLVVLERVRLQGNTELRMTPEEFHAAIMEALDLATNPEIPYATARVDRGHVQPEV